MTVPLWTIPASPASVNTGVCIYDRLASAGASRPESSWIRSAERIGAPWLWSSPACRHLADPPLVNTCVSGGPQALVRRCAARLNMLVTCSRSRRRASRGHPQPEGTATSQHEPRGAQDLVAALNVVYGCPARRPSMRRASATAPASFCRRRRRRRSRASSLTLASAATGRLRGASGGPGSAIRAWPS
jgi:hypothetical protein